MRYSQSAAALVAALSISGAVAGPTRRHVHHQHHAKKDNYNVDWKTLDWEHMGIDWASAYSAGLAKASSTATPTPTPSSASPAVVAAAVTSSPAAAASSAAAANPIDAAVSAIASGVSDAVDAVESFLEGVKVYANDITSFGTEVTASGSTGDFYSGNYGNPYGHNMMKVSSKTGHQYTIEFVNTSGKSMSIFIWNKVGSDGRVLSGSALAPKDTALTLTLAAGASQIVAFQENSQIGFAQACSEKAASGAFATTWGEVNFVKTGSGYDVSAIMNPNNNNYNMTMTSEEAPQCTSDRTQNFWLTDTQPIGDSDGSCYIAQNHATIKVLMGGTI